MARAMLLHVKLHWSEEFNLIIWLFVVDYAIFIYNNLLFITNQTYHLKKFSVEFQWDADYLNNAIYLDAPIIYLLSNFKMEKEFLNEKYENAETIVTIGLIT